MNEKIIPQPKFGFVDNCGLNKSRSNAAQATRREFLRRVSMAALGLFASSAWAANADWMRVQLHYFRGESTLARIMKTASKDQWQDLPIGEIVANVALQLENKRCQFFTLDVSPDTEYCAVNLDGFDCFTFIEACLCIARVIKRGKSSPEDLIDEIQFTRYRGGKMGDFTSRLHYTTDWFYDNEKKSVMTILTPKLPGAEPFLQKVGFMTMYPKRYRQLETHPEFRPIIKAIESEINGRALKYLPMENLKTAVPLLQSGDLIGITARVAGIDIKHCGLCLKGEKGRVHFMEASSLGQYRKVIYDSDLTTCMKWSPSITGVMVVRPRELI